MIDNKNKREQTKQEQIKTKKNKRIQEKEKK